MIRCSGLIYTLFVISIHFEISTSGPENLYEKQQCVRSHSSYPIPICILGSSKENANEIMSNQTSSLEWGWQDGFAVKCLLHKHETWVQIYITQVKSPAQSVITVSRRRSTESHWLASLISLVKIWDPDWRETLFPKIRWKIPGINF